MSERFGVGLGLLSCSFGAGGAIATRYLVDSVDPITIAAIRFGGGALCLSPLMLVLPIRWPTRSDWFAVVVLSLSFYAGFFILYNIALAYTTVARATLALSTLPLITMLAAYALGKEQLSLRKSSGVLIAMSGVALALGSDIGSAPATALRGDFIMIAATICMAVYSIYARPLVDRSSPFGFLIGGMSAGGVVLIATSALSGGGSKLPSFDTEQWIAACYLAVGAGALAFALWIYALEFASPTRVTNTMTVNPLVAGVGAYVLLGEPLTWNFSLGLVAVFAGIWIATKNTRGVNQTPQDS